MIHGKDYRKFIKVSIIDRFSKCLWSNSIYAIHPKLEPSIGSISISGVIIVYGILKDQLFDIEKIVTKSISYLVVFFVIAWVFLE